MKVLALLLALCAAHQAHARGLYATGPAFPSPFPLFGQPKLAKEQADSFVGVYQLESPDDQHRVDGSIMDGVVLDLLKSLKDGADVTPADLNKAISKTVKESSSVLNYELVVPGVDARTGLFTAYRLISNGTFSSGKDAWQPGQEFIDVKRIVGMAYAGPDGAIYWQGTDNVDTALYQGYLPKEAKAMEILRLEGTEVWNEAGTRTLDDQSTVQLLLTKIEDGSSATPSSARVAAVLKRLQDSLPLQSLKAEEAVSR